MRAEFCPNFNLHGNHCLSKAISEKLNRIWRRCPAIQATSPKRRVGMSWRPSLPLCSVSLQSLPGTKTLCSETISKPSGPPRPAQATGANATAPRESRDSPRQDRGRDGGCQIGQTVSMERAVERAYVGRPLMVGLKQLRLAKDSEHILDFLETRPVELTPVGDQSIFRDRANGL